MQLHRKNLPNVPDGSYSRLQKPLKEFLTIGWKYLKDILSRMRHIQCRLRNLL